MTPVDFSMGALKRSNTVGRMRKAISPYKFVPLISPPGGSAVEQVEREKLMGGRLSRSEACTG